MQPPAAQPLSSAGTAAPESASDLLRSRLSRAVEDQLSEQQELVSAMSDMRAQLMRLGREIGELRVQPGREELTDAHVNTVTVEMREAVRFLSERLDGVTRMLALRGEELADVRISLSALDTQLVGQADSINELAADLQRLPKDDGRTSALHDDLRTLHRQMVSIEEAISAPRPSDPSDRLAAIEAAVLPIAAALADIRYVSAAQSEQVEQLRNRIEPIATDVTAIGGDVAGLVEGTADGAALDARVNESVTAAMRASERRLMAHIDEAVLALAETLLLRRTPGAAGALTNDPGATLEASETEAEAPASVDSTPADPAGVSAEAEPEPVAPTGQLWAQPAAAGADEGSPATPPAVTEDGPARDETTDTTEIPAIVDPMDDVDENDLDADILVPDWLTTTTSEDGATYTSFGVDDEARTATSPWTPDLDAPPEPIDDTVTPEDAPKRRRRWF